MRRVSSHEDFIGHQNRNNACRSSQMPRAADKEQRENRKLVIFVKPNTFSRPRAPVNYIQYFFDRQNDDGSSMIIHFAQYDEPSIDNFQRTVRASDKVSTKVFFKLSLRPQRLGTNLTYV